MSKQNKITSYFKNTSRVNKFETDNNSPTVIDLMSDDEDDQTLKRSEFESSPSKVAFDDDPTNFLTAMVKDFLSKPALHRLFCDSEMRSIESFSQLPTAHRKILVRMYWLRWKWYKVEDMAVKYLKVDCIGDYSTQIVRLLQERGFFLNGESAMSHEDWASVSNKVDLIKVCKHFKIRVGKADKGTLLSALKKFSATKSIFNSDSRRMDVVVLKMFNTTIGECIKITETCKSIFDRLHLLMYLGINPAILREKQLNLLLINVKNGQQHFPTATIDLDCQSCIFPSKLHFDEYARARDIFEQLVKLVGSPPCDHKEIVKISRQSSECYKRVSENKSVDDWYPEPWLHRFTPRYSYIKSLEISVGSYKALKTDEYLDEALSILDLMLAQKQYRQHKRALWHNEKALILHARLRQFEKAAVALTAALEEKDISEDAKAPLKDRAKRLAKQKNINLSNEIRQNLIKLSKDSLIDTIPYIEISAHSLDDKMPGKKARYVFRDAVSEEKIYSSVEDYALLHYINNLQYSDGDHWEGRIITSIFVLLFWDIIYSNSEKGTGIFVSRYQEAPLDLYTDGFYENRKRKIEDRLTDIDSKWKGTDEIIDFMNNNFISRHAGEVSLFDKKLEWTKLTDVVRCLGRNATSCICRRLSLNYQYAHSGFPDLTVWNRFTKKIKFVEVKGDGDKLSHKQIQWMMYLMKCGIETEVCYVHKGNNIKRKTNKKSPENKLTTPKKKLSSPKKDEEDVFNVKTSPKKRQLKNESPKSPKSANSNHVSECYLRSPTKFSKGVGYYVSPSSSNSQSSGTNTSPVKSRKRLSLSLTRRRIFDIDK